MTRGPDARFNDTLRVDDDGWRLVETGFEEDRAVAVGSNFTVANGYLGYRATAPEQGAEDFVALTVSDTYDCADGRWRELVNAPNPLMVTFAVDGTTLRLEESAEPESWLDLRAGVNGQRRTHVLDEASITLTVERFASYDNLHLLCQRVTVESDAPLEMQLRCGIDGNVWDLNGVHLPTLDPTIDGDVTALSGVTGESGIGVAVAAAHRLDGDVPTEEPATGDRLVARTVTLDLQPDQPLVLETFAAVATSSDVEDPLAVALNQAAAAAAEGFGTLLERTTATWQGIWGVMDVRIEGDVLDDASLRFSNYHNRVHTPLHTDHLPVGARGLSCQAYQGAAFWDQEVYNLPAFLFTEPEVARSILAYRHKTLDGARTKARDLGYDGAYYAWVSGVTGEELCPDVFFVDVLTGREIRNHFNVWQMHVSPDIVTTIRTYVDVTGDTAFMVEHGAEVAFEVARFLRSFVHFNDWGGQYHIIRLLGPDEWHENVDDNAFTNYQTHAALTFAIETYEWLEQEHADALTQLSAEMGLQASEVDRWRHVRDNLFLPQPDETTGLIEQFRGFFDLEDISPEELATRLQHPDEYWGWPNGIAVRTQVAKQADVVMLLWLHRERFSGDVVRANHDYYEPRCAHKSSLSDAAYGMVAAQMGDTAVALRHFRETARVDLLNAQHAVVAGTFIGGIHTAACGGTNQLAVQGLGGLGFVQDMLTVDPRLPEAWTRLTYPVQWRGQRLTILVAHDGVTVQAEEANSTAVALSVAGVAIEVRPGEAATIDLASR
ncbi:glycoside hydrolase family 65 protein [Euzebya tangerina]|uniref:glycoside hydrolase family 65 protein n=1 Tax=Euzebya tangerina TaxID=591198 RepID=UPI0013C35C39|nr:glycoside hydrolase family 65 protein [Euzebya tangerina]